MGPGWAACFGASNDPVAWRHVVRNLGLLVVALVASTSTRTGLSGAGAVLATGLAALAALLVVRLDDVVDLFAVRPPEVSWPS